MYTGSIKQHEYKLQVKPSANDLSEIDRMYELNKNCVQQLPLLPEYLHGSSPLDVAQWLLIENFNNWAYLELDIEIDLPTWQKEITGIDEYFVPHPDQPYQTLYQSCTFHGISAQHTMHYTHYVDWQDVSSESEMPYTWTELADKCPTITKFWKDFPMEQWYRVRPLKIGASGYIGVHRDMTIEDSINWNIIDMEFGINMSITHPEGCETWFEEYGKVPWAPGKFFLHNVSKMHWVTNFTPYDRVHMIPMGRVGNRAGEFAKIVARSYLKSTNQNVNLVNVED